MADQRAPACSSDRCVRLAIVISVVLLAVIAAVVAFGHVRELALRHGEAQWSATLIPLSSDVMPVAASMSVLLTSKMAWRLAAVDVPQRRELGQPRANVAVADATVISRLSAAWPSFAGLTTCFKASSVSGESA
jgi:hypothetical protein